MKKRKQKPRPNYKEMKKRSSVQRGIQMDLMEAYNENPAFQEEVLNDSEECLAAEGITQSQLAEVHVNEEDQSEAELWEDKEETWSTNASQAVGTKITYGMQKPDGGENMFLPAYMRQQSRGNAASSRSRFNRKTQPEKVTEFPPLLTQSENEAKIEKVNGHGEDAKLSAETNEATDTEATVPSEIRARGPLAIEAYNKALREGRTSLKRFPVMLIGQDRSGKTSLKKSLRGQLFNPNEASTIGIEKDPSHFQVTTEIWKTGGKGEEETSDTATSYEHHAAKLIVSSLTEEKQLPSEDVREPILSESPSTDLTDDPSLVNELPTLRNGYPSSQADRFASKQNLKQEERALGPVQSEGYPNAKLDSPAPSNEFASSFSDFTNTILQESETSDMHDSKTTDVPRESVSILTDEPEVPQDIARLVEKLLHEGTKVEDEDIYSVLWDFGGQAVYYVTHPLFLTPKAIYILVYDLSRNPCGRVEPLLMQGMFKILKDQFCLKTNLDYLDFWMTSVSSLTSQDEPNEVHSSPKYEVLPEKLPPVFLVCSHADKPYGAEDPLTIANDIFDDLQRKPYSNHLVERVFVVNNTLSGSEFECPEVVRLRQHILVVAKELPQMENVIPVKWLKYEKALDIAEKDGHKWISHLKYAKLVKIKNFSLCSTFYTIKEL